MTASRPAARVRKARRSSKLDCGHWVPVGHKIARLGTRWACIECVLAAWRRIQAEPPKPGRGGITTTERNEP